MTATINPAGTGSIMESLYALRDNPDAEIKPEAPKTETTETATVETTPAADKTLESAQVTGDTKQESTEEEDHTPLPPAAQKRLDKEIARTVSARKEAEAITARLKAQETTTVKQGTEPVKPATEAATGKPKRPTEPVYGEGAGNESETWERLLERKAAYRQELEKYDDDLFEWAATTSEKRAEQKIAARSAQEAHDATIKQAVKDHGEDFLALTQQVADHSPIEFQHALLEIEDWPSLAVYLARDQDKLTAVVEKFKKSPIAAIETLGRMRAGLKGSSSKPATQEKPLPVPLKPVAGSGTVVTSVDLNKLAEEKPGALQGKLREMFPERIVKRG